MPLLVSARGHVVEPEEFGGLVLVQLVEVRGRGQVVRSGHYKYASLRQNKLKMVLIGHLIILNNTDGLVLSYDRLFVFREAGTAKAAEEVETHFRRPDLHNVLGGVPLISYDELSHEVRIDLAVEEFVAVEIFGVLLAELDCEFGEIGWIFSDIGYIILNTPERPIDIQFHTGCRLQVHILFVVIFLMIQHELVQFNHLPDECIKFLLFETRVYVLNVVEHLLAQALQFVVVLRVFYHAFGAAYEFLVPIQHVGGVGYQIVFVEEFDKLLILKNYRILCKVILEFFSQFFCFGNVICCLRLTQILFLLKAPLECKVLGVRHWHV